MICAHSYLKGQPDASPGNRCPLRVTVHENTSNIEERLPFLRKLMDFLTAPEETSFVVRLDCMILERCEQCSRVSQVIKCGAVCTRNRGLEVFDRDHKSIDSAIQSKRLQVRTLLLRNKVPNITLCYLCYHSRQRLVRESQPLQPTWKVTRNVKYRRRMTRDGKFAKSMKDVK